MKTRKALTAVLICAMLLATIGCAAASSETSTAYEPQADYATASEESYAGYAYDGEINTSVTSDTSAASGASGETTGDFDVRKIVYNATMSITADDPEATLNALIAKTEELGGYVSGSYTTTDDLGAYYSTATLKVPAAQLDALVTTAQAQGKVDSYRLSSDDISLSYYDIQARLDNAKAEEQQLIEILAKCDTIKDILAVRESLTSVRADIESYTAQINLWDNLVAYATLDVTIDRTPATAVEGETELIQLWKASDVWGRMERGFSNSVRFMVNAIGAIGIFLAVVIIPAGVLFLIIGLPIILHHKKKRRKALAARMQQAPAQPAAEPTRKNE